MEQGRSTLSSDPNAVAFEEIVIGAILLDPEAIVEIAGELYAGHFYDAKLSKVYQLVMEMYDSGAQIDLYTVVQKCKGVRELKGVNVASMLTGCTLKIGSGAHLLSHARVIKERYIARELIKTGIKLQGLASDISSDITDIVDFLSKQADFVNELAVGGNPFRNLGSIVSDALKETEKRVISHNEGKATGITTGISSLNKLTGGWQKSQLIILGARPSMGKTALMLHFAKAAAKEGVAVCLFSLEMSDIPLANRLLLSETKVDADKFRQGNLSLGELRQLEVAGAKLSKLPIAIDDTANISMRQVKARSQLLQKRGKCDMIMLDYLQLVDVSGGNRNALREQEIAQASRQAKIIAKELDVPVVLLSQLSRKVEERSAQNNGKMPVLSDLRESGAIEQDADIVAFLYRPAYYEIDEFRAGGSLGPISSIGLGVIDVAKQRDGATGHIIFNHNSSMTTITDYSPFNRIQSVDEGEDEQPF